MNNSMINFQLPVETIAGESVQIISFNARGDYPVIGYIGKDTYLHRWNLKGYNALGSLPDVRDNLRNVITITEKEFISEISEKLSLPKAVKLIDWDLPVETLVGEPVEIISLNERGDYPVIGYIGTKNTSIFRWDLEGKFFNYDKKLYGTCSCNLRNSIKITPVVTRTIKPETGNTTNISCTTKSVKTEIPINWSKPVRTLDGRNVEIISTNGKGKKPILGYIEGKDNIREWRVDGKSLSSGQSSCADLENSPQEFTGYVNIYYTETHFGKLYADLIHMTREDADKPKNSSNRIACVKISFIEGQLDE